MSSNINVTGWTGDGYLFLEFQNTGVGGDYTIQRVGATLLSGSEASIYSIPSVLGIEPAILGGVQWVDPLYFSSCYGAFSQCGGLDFTGAECCSLPNSCVEQTASKSLSPSHSISSCTV
jgi:Fungal cellulose binding domain